MTHWRTKENMSHKKRRAKNGVMTRKEERKFFGHGFGSFVYPAKMHTTLEIDGEDYLVVLHPDKNGNLVDISGVPEDDEEVSLSGTIPSTYNYAMNMLRGQNVQLI